MITALIIFLVMSVVAAIVCYIATSNIIFSLAILLIYVAYYFLFQYKRIKKYFFLTRRVHSCCFFINSFVITMSVKESYEEGFKSGIAIKDDQLHLFAGELEELSSFEKVKYLKNYFKLTIYMMFLNVLEIYQDQGGNILTMTENLMRECTRTEKQLTDSSNLGVKHLIEFALLWSMSFAVLLFLKFGLGDFYQKMLNVPIFAPAIFIFFLLCLLSIHLFLNTFLNLSIKEDLSDEKTN